MGSVCVARDLSETRKSLAELSLMNARLKGLVEEADKRNRELTLINSMAEKLQSCLSLDEAYPLIAQYAQALFPARSGALFIHGPHQQYDGGGFDLGGCPGWGTGLSSH